MNPTLLGTASSETHPIHASMYRHDNGDLTLWLKVGVATIEIKPEMLDEIMSILSDAGTFYFDKEPTL